MTKCTLGCDAYQHPNTLMLICFSKIVWQSFSRVNSVIGMLKDQQPSLSDHPSSEQASLTEALITDCLIRQSWAGDE